MSYNMKIFLKKISALKQDEVFFIFSMMRKYGGMPDVDISEQTKKQPQNHRGKPNNKRKNTLKKGIIVIDHTKPNLFDFDDPKWKTCDDEKFLAYKELMERTYV